MNYHISSKAGGVVLVALTGLISILTWTACTSDVVQGTLQLKLEESVGAEELTFDNLIYESLAGHAYSVVTLRYYLSRVQIRSKAGALLDLADVIYYDARDADNMVLSIKDIPNGEYTSLEFIFGLDEVMNVDGGLENTLQNINMEWPIPGDQGYHYMKFEGKYDMYHTDTIRSFNLHLGATGGNQNYFHVTLPLSSLVIDGNTWEITLSMDVNEWLQNPNMYDFETYGPAIMMNQNAQEVLKANGTTIFSVTSVRRTN